MKVVLVTGASSGIGRAVAEHLAAAGHTVFGTSRDPGRAGPPPPGVRLLALDVTSDSSAQEVVWRVLADAGRLDVLVNNAGYTLAGALEEATLDQAHALFETDFFGAVRMTAQVLPDMRRRRAGQIVNVSSGLAQARAPFTGFYASAKSALEAYSEALWHEVRPFGVRVSVVAPGYVATRIEAAAVQASERIEDYAPARGRVLAAIHRRLERGMDPRVVARRIGDLLECEVPPLYVAAGADARAVAALRRLLPPAAFRRLMRSLFGLPNTS
jgi:NAD(P)-dependent dehydrogenase (short-subunit alcohol dehydrogenase family)